MYVPDKLRHERPCSSRLGADARIAARSGRSTLVVLLLACGCVPWMAMAKCTKIGDVTSVKPSIGSAITAAKNAKVGDVVATTTISLPYRAYGYCENGGNNFFQGKRPLVSGYKDVYDIGVPGLGAKFTLFAWGWSNTMPSGWWWGTGNFYLYWTTSLRMDIIRTSAFISSGTATSGQYGTIYQDDSLEVLNISIPANGIVIKMAGCTTPDVTVNMGNHPASEFSGIGSVSTATSFNIDLNSCPSGFTAVRYQVNAVTSLLNSASSVVALDGASTATGIGVQLLDNNGAVLPLGTQQSFSGYNTAGGDFKIPLKARYYQSGTSVGAGTANTSMVFTITYQ